MALIGQPKFNATILKKPQTKITFEIPQGHGCTLILYMHDSPFQPNSGSYFGTEHTNIDSKKIQAASY